MFIEHPLLKANAIESRAYQVNIARSCLTRSTLVVLPTGMGKTIVALEVIAEVLRDRGGRILFLAPTKPLVEQHATTLRELLLRKDIAIFTGEVKPEDRSELWKENKIITSTPQVIKNDLEAGRIKLDDVTLIIFDEAHRAVGDYAYVFIGEEYRKNDGLVMGITASPGSSAKKILEVCENVGITSVEIRTEYDPDVVKYVHDISLDWIRVDVPEELRFVIELLKKARDGQIKQLRKYGYLRTGRPMVTTKELLNAGKRIQADLRTGKKFQTYHASTAQAMAMKINHAIELAETQGADSVRSYFDRLNQEAKSKDASKASKRVLKIPEVEKAARACGKIFLNEPKMMRVQDIVSNQISKKKDSRIIVYTHYRDTSEMVTKRLAASDEVRPVRFVGQATRGRDRGLSQKEQVEMIEDFKKGTYNVLVATSVAEEGLDIPSTDMVVFYEPVPSEIRTIQRRGRTGRKMPGKVVVLGSKATRDEAYFYSAQRKEKKMHMELEKLRKELKQMIFVGEPGGKMFEQIGEIEKPYEPLGELLVKEKEQKRVVSKRKGQTTFDDFGE
ncbi:MAG: DEAD/DEAH box helicase [Methanobacteriota archaeon]|nr:MAG: DEAD/DEAH box helicase [Euryarchaeota archaeon]